MLCIIFLILLAITGYIIGVVLPQKKYEEKQNQYNEALNRGDYKTAYGLCDELEKNKEQLIVENLLAYLSNNVAEGLKNRDSFVLRDIWYDKTKKQIVISYNGTNSYGGIVVNYNYYTYDTNNKCYKLFVYLSSLDEETTYSFDTDSE